MRITRGYRRALPSLAVAVALWLAAGGAGAAPATPAAEALVAAPAGETWQVAGELSTEPAIRLRNPSTRLTQQYLRRRGYAPGPPADRLNAQTRSAIRSFQRDCGLPANGAAVTATQQRLIRPGSCPSGR